MYHHLSSRSILLVVTIFEIWVRSSGQQQERQAPSRATPSHYRAATNLDDRMEKSEQRVKRRASCEVLGAEVLYSIVALGRVMALFS